MTSFSVEVIRPSFAVSDSYWMLRWACTFEVPRTLLAVSAVKVLEYSMFWPFLASVDSVYTLVACFSESPRGGALTPSEFSATVMTMVVDVDTEPLNTEIDPVVLIPCVSNVALVGSAAMTAPAKSAMHKSVTHMMCNFIS